ncbi:MAG TPA: hypothetical protein VMD09_17890 [Solirubrobacteraceae bacterium]|nr:hypothetical protein [Solirubrobacteraceae bacterium]
MPKSFEPGALLGHVYTLGGGLLVRLRLARSSDAPAIKRLLEEQGRGGSDFEIARLVHFDPRRRYVVCATGLVDSTEVLLGVGAIGLDGVIEPDLLIVDGQCPEQVAELLRTALVACAARAA